MDVNQILEIIKKMKLVCAPSEAGTGRWKGLDDLEKKLNQETKE